ncbi:MAG: DMT family transporter [Bacteroidota bacterium]
MPSKFTVHGALFLVALLYGANYSIAKIALPEYISPFGFILLRLIVATALFWLLDVLNPSEKIDKADFWLFVKCAFFGAAANMLFFFKGLSMTNPINASVIMTLTPIVVLLTAFFMKQEKMNLKKIVGVMVGAIGAYLLITKDGISLTQNTFLGDILVLLNGSTYAVYLVLVKPLMIKYKPTTVIKWVFLFGMLMCVPFGTAELAAVEWPSIPVEAWLSVAYAVVGATFLVYLLNIWALQYVNASVVGIYIYLQPLIATVVAVAFRGDKLELITVLYALVIMIGVFMVSRK